MCLGMLDEFECKGCGKALLQDQGVCFSCGRIVFENDNLEDTSEDVSKETIMTTQ